MKAYKVTDKDMQCRGFQFALGKKFSVKGKVKCCANGFHACERLIDTFQYYEFTPENRVFEVKLSGKIERTEDQVAARHIEFIRELSWEEVLHLVNIGEENDGIGNSGRYNSGGWNSGAYNLGHHNSGRNNSGNCNSGNCNSGHSNSGSCNLGDCNSGHGNSGDDNSGSWNSGHHNSWHHNSGSFNSGRNNSGNFNSGYNNSGEYNSSNRNSGDYNSGNNNSGEYNSGNDNSGHRNSGHYNSGNGNSGDGNSGHNNSGNYNSGDNHAGMLNSCEAPLMLFNKKATQDDLKKVPYFEVRYAVWKYNDDLPRSLQCKTTEGRLLKCSHKRAWERAWAGISRRDRHKMFSLKQFSCKVFKEVTGLDVRKEYDEWKKRKKK